MAKQVYEPTPTGAQFHAAAQVMGTRTAEQEEADEDFPVDVRAIVGPVGCLPAGCQVMTPSGWVNIEAWEQGTPILVWDKGTGAARFEEPEAYINEPADGWYRFIGAGVELRVSPEHTIPYRDAGGAFRKAPAQVLARRGWPVAIILYDEAEGERPAVVRPVQPYTDKPSPGERKYCFTTSTGFFVCRNQDGSIWVSGNSGKSVACVMEMLYRAMAQPAIKGVRKSRWLVARRTFSELKTTTIATFNEWVGPMGTMTWGSPIEWKCNKKLPDGTYLDMHVIFRSLDGPYAVSNLKSLELTGAWLNEAGEMQDGLLHPLIGRTGRYPKFDKDDREQQELAKYFWSGVILDTNPPSTSSWFYRMFEIERPKGFKVFHQPPALLYDADAEKYVPNPAAENVKNHREGYNYWLKQLAGASNEFIRVMILGEYGAIFSGQPVFGESWDDRTHVSKEPIAPMPTRPLIVGIDWGMQPAAVFTQMAPSGAVYVLDELTPKRIFLEDFIEQQILPLLNEKYRGMQVLFIGDPAGSGRDARSRLDSFQFLQQRGLAAQPAPTNDPVLRIEAVNHFLRRKDGFLLDHRCTVLREGFLGGYHFEERVTSSGVDVLPKPFKNEFSHPHDALQYAALYYFGGVTTDMRKAARKLKRRGTPKQRRPFLYA